VGIADKYRKGSSSQGAADLGLSSGVMARLEALAEFMTQDTWADGSVRELPTLLVFVDDGRWKCCINDRGEERSAWASGPTVESVLSSLDEQLATGTVEWRGSFQRKGRKS